MIKSSAASYHTRPTKQLKLSISDKKMRKVLADLRLIQSALEIIDAADFGKLSAGVTFTAGIVRDILSENSSTIRSSNNAAN